MKLDKTKVMSTLKAHKTVSPSIDEKAVNYLVDMINYVNSQDNHLTQVNGHALSEYKLPTHLQGLIYPEKVSATSGLASKDCLLRDTFDGKVEDLPSPVQFHEALEIIYASQKVPGGPNLNVTLASARQAVTLGESFYQLPIGETGSALYHFDGANIDHLPMTLNLVGLFSSYYYNCDSTELENHVYHDFFAKLV